MAAVGQTLTAAAAMTLDRHRLPRQARAALFARDCLPAARPRMPEEMARTLAVAAEDAALSDTDYRAVADFLAALASAAEPVEVHFRWRPQLPDPADELILEAAVNGRADAVVTHNVRDFQVAAKAFGVPVLTPAQVLQELRR